MHPPLISAIILNYRSPQHTVRCLRALLNQSIADRMEIVVVDNHSRDDSIGVLQNQLGRFPQVRLLEAPRNTGFGKGYNLGIRRARGTYLLINNPAKILAPESVERMARAMESDPTIGVLGPKLIYADGTIRDSSRGFPRITDVFIKRTFLRWLCKERMRAYLQWDRDPHQTRDVDWVVGGCLMIRADVAKQLQGFDPRFFLFFEDIDLCRRVRQAGKRVVYFPEAHGTDRKQRLSEGGIASMLLKPTGRSHLKSALQYFWKWRHAG